MPADDNPFQSRAEMERKGRFESTERQKQLNQVAGAIDEQIRPVLIQLSNAEGFVGRVVSEGIGWELRRRTNNLVSQRWEDYLSVALSWYRPLPVLSGSSGMPSGLDSDPYIGSRKGSDETLSLAVQFADSSISLAGDNMQTLLNTLARETGLLAWWRPKSR